MKKRLLTVALLAFLVGCGQQPELDIDADQNNTEQNRTEQNQTELPDASVNSVSESKSEYNTTQIGVTQTDLTDNTAVDVTENSDSSLTNDTETQNLAKTLSQKIIHFDFDKYNIRNDQLSIVEETANLLKDSKGNFTVRIEGNCDEWGSDEYNYALGLKRAKTIKQALIDLGVDKNKLTIISYGESNPVCTAHNKECWAKNRRDNFTLLP